MQVISLNDKGYREYLQLTLGPGPGGRTVVTNQCQCECIGPGPVGKDDYYSRLILNQCNGQH